jgi:membrane-associated phospholipid phosphatase
MQRVKPSGWWFDVALLAAFGVVTLLLALKTPLLSVDLAVRDFADSHRPVAFYWTLRAFNYFGQGGLILTPLAALTGLFFAVRSRSIRPLLPVVFAFIILYVTVGPLKLVTDRAAASSKIEHPEWIFHDPGGLSYPSGHIVNSIVWYGVLALLLKDHLDRRIIAALRFAAPAIVAFTTTYLSFHWITDDLAALLLGVVLDRLVRRIPWETVRLTPTFGRRSAVAVPPVDRDDQQTVRSGPERSTGSSVRERE